MSRPAVFIDRDGTFVDDPGYLRDPALVRLLPGAAEAFARLARTGFELVVVTNQSGIGRGIISPTELDSIHGEIERQIDLPPGTAIHWYFCPHHPDAGCSCRKPGTALHRLAAADLDLTMTGSWCIGDRISDLAPARELGISGILVLTGAGEAHAAAALAGGFRVAPSLTEAVEIVVSG